MNYNSFWNNFFYVIFQDKEKQEETYIRQKYSFSLRTTNKSDKKLEDLFPLFLSFFFFLLLGILNVHKLCYRRLNFLKYKFVAVSK